MNVGFFVNALTWLEVEMVIGLLISRLINGHFYVTFLFASSLTLKCFFNGHIEFSQGFTITIAPCKSPLSQLSLSAVAKL